MAWPTEEDFARARVVFVGHEHDIVYQVDLERTVATAFAKQREDLAVFVIVHNEDHDGGEAVGIAFDLADAKTKAQEHCDSVVRALAMSSRALGWRDGVSPKQVEGRPGDIWDGSGYGFSYTITRHRD